MEKPGWRLLEKKIQVSASKSVKLDIFIFLNSWKKIVEGRVEFSTCYL